MSYGDNTYQQRREARIERYLELADKRAADSKAAFETSHRYTDGIPFGQPILVGHHSERRHRNALRKSWDAMGRSVEAQKKAEYWRQRAAAAASNNAIYRDDPDAVDLLKQKLAEMEKKQSQFKIINKIVRKYRTSRKAEGIAEMVKQMNVSEATAAKMYEPDCFGGIGIPSYALQNNNANIRRVKLRIASLDRVAAAPAPDEIEGNGITLIKNPHNGRYEMRFPGKPAPATIERMKAGGWIARRKDGEWYWLSGWGDEAAKKLAGELMGLEIK